VGGFYVGQKDTIISLLRQNGVMTQGALTETMYGDKHHTPNIYSALMSLVNAGVVIRTGHNLSYYSLDGVTVIKPAPKATTSKREYRDVSSDVINNETLNEASVKTGDFHSFKAQYNGSKPPRFLLPFDYH
jgi:hypothetical protein